jgi:hypothetical protein
MSSPNTSPLSRFWSQIRQATAQHSTTSALWDSVRKEAARVGTTISGGSFLEMNRLRALASRQEYAKEAFNKLSDESALTSKEIAEDIISRPSAAQSLVREYKVQYQHQIDKDGEIQTVWRTDYFDGALPQTKRDLLEMLAQEGEMLTQKGGSDEGAESLGIGDVLITEV